MVTFFFPPSLSIFECEEYLKARGIQCVSWTHPDWKLTGEVDWDTLDQCYWTITIAI